jgi:hypothetical protein
MCLADFRHDFGSKIVKVLFEKKPHFKLTIFEFAVVWSGGGGGATVTIFKFFRQGVGASY